MSLLQALIAAKLSGSGGGGSVTVDAELSTSSENPVQNKVIAEALTGKVSVEQGKANAGKFLIVGSVIVP